MCLAEGAERPLQWGAGSAQSEGGTGSYREKARDFLSAPNQRKVLGCTADPGRYPPSRFFRAR